ncbi:MAG: CNNM domain-containing protein [Nitrosomonas sp.]|uniref:CNNM domain-containing protein n=1 Tax=Nitrosomonas sp. TaxID=42353 RepID=UPI00272795FD|nr:CNNM domain-containing protein [Nitrosomonas sp.]MDO9470361.1 CNNM domain-containing protein [Nitrosomonas sp.]MDP2222894.1 CNNM domain-containing protein [Nitrosomonas sp.]
MLASSYVLTPLLVICYPVVWFVNLFVRGLLVLLRLKPQQGELQQKISSEERRTLVLEGAFHSKQTSEHTAESV